LFTEMPNLIFLTLGGPVIWMPDTDPVTLPLLEQLTCGSASGSLM
jgi:hypothetical protein